MDSIVSSLYGAISKHIQELMILFKTAKDADTIPIITHFPEIVSCIKQLKSIKHDPTRYNELRQYCNEIINYILMDADEQPVEPIDENDYDILNFENKNITTQFNLNSIRFKYNLACLENHMKTHSDAHAGNYIWINIAKQLITNKNLASEIFTQIYLSYVRKNTRNKSNDIKNYSCKSFKCVLNLHNGEDELPCTGIKMFLELKYSGDDKLTLNGVITPNIFVFDASDFEIINLLKKICASSDPKHSSYIGVLTAFESYTKQQYSFKFIKLMQNRFNKLFDMPIIREIPDAEKDKETLLKELSELKQKNKKYDTERTEEVCCICLTPKYADDEIFVSTCGHVMHKKCFIKYHYVPAYSICRKAHPIK